MKRIKWLWVVAIITMATNKKELLDKDNVKQKNEVDRNNVLRDYRADGYLFAYKDGDYHIVVSRGNESSNTWQIKIPATQEHAVPGQIRWTIPDNWDLIVKSTGKDNGGIYKLPDGMFARVSYPKNNYLVDAWYQVKEVGDLATNLVGSIASYTELIEFIKNQKEDTHLNEKDIEVLNELKRNWNFVETALNESLKWVAEHEKNQQYKSNRIHNWKRVRQHYYYDMSNIMSEIDLDADSETQQFIIDLLRNNNLIPNQYETTIEIDESVIDMEYLMRSCLELGGTPAQALDWVMTGYYDYTQDEWAKERNRGQGTISENVSTMKKLIKNK